MEGRSFRAHLSAKFSARNVQLLLLAGSNEAAATAVKKQETLAVRLEVRLLLAVNECEGKLF